MTEYLLGIDLGTSAVKALLTGDDGRVVASASAEYPIHSPAPDRAEQSTEEWWRATAGAVRDVVAQAPDAGIAAIGLSGQMHGTVLLGEDGRVLAPAIIWPDRRSAEQVRKITATVGAERLYSITGSPVATGFLAATARWFQEQAPDLWQQVHTLLLPKDFLRYRMTGALATDPSDAAGALLLDETARTWSAELLDALDFRRSLLPPILPSAAVGGYLQPDAADALGLRAGIPVAVGAADTACSALGAGVVAHDQLLLTIGTGGQLVQPCETVHIDRHGRIHTFCSALEPGEGRSGWYQMGAMLAAGLALRWLREQLYDEPQDVGFEAMMALAAKEEPGAGGLLFLPYLVGERTPYMDPTARGVFFGLTLTHNRGSLIRAVIEGVTLAAYNAYGVLHELGANPQQVVLAGGGATSRVWQQIVADVFGLPVQSLRITEQSASGAAVLAGSALGALEPASAARQWARYGDIIEPNAANHSRYLERLEAFQSLYRRNAGWFGVQHT